MWPSARPVLSLSPSLRPLPPPGALSLSLGGTVIPVLLGPSREFNFTKCRDRPFIQLTLFPRVKPNGSGRRQVRPSRLGLQCARVSKLSNLRVLSRPAGSPGRRDLQDGSHLHRSELKRNTMKHSAPLDALATLPVLRDHACRWPWSWARPQAISMAETPTGHTGPDREAAPPWALP